MTVGSISSQKDIESVIESYLQARLPGIMTAAARKVNISELSIASGTIGNMAVGKIVLGNATIDKLVVTNTSANVQSGHAYLRNMRVNLELRFTLDWWYDIWVYSDHGSNDLGSLWFNLPLGDALVPSLQNIGLTIPSMEVDNFSATMAPLTNLNLGAASMTGVLASQTSLPVAGFQLTGLGLGAFSLSNAQVPATYTKQAKVDDLKPQAPLLLPQVSVSALSIPQATAGDIHSAGIAVDGVTDRRGISADLGVFGVTIWVQPVAHIAIAELFLQEVHLSANLGLVQLQNLHVPVDIQGVGLTDITLTNVTVNNISG